MKKNLEDNNNTGITVLLVAPFLSYLIAGVSLKEFPLFWNSFYFDMWNNNMWIF